MPKLSLTQSTVSTFKPRPTPYDVRDTKVTGFLARVQTSGVVSYIVQYRDLSGTQRSYTIGIDGDGWNATTAREKAEEIRYKAARGSDPHLEKRTAKVLKIANNANTLGSYFEGEYQYHLETKKPSSQQESRRIIYTEFADLLDIPLTEISAKWVRDWRHKRRNKGIEGEVRSKPLKNETLKRYNAELDVILQKAVEDKLLIEHPLRGSIRPIKGDNRNNVKPRFLSPDERAKLWESLRERDEEQLAKAESGRQWKIDRHRSVQPSRSTHRFADHLTPMVLVSLNTGMRKKELFHLHWDDIASDYSMIELRAETTKTGSTRTLPLNDEARDILSAWRAQTSHRNYPLVFPNANGEVFRDVKTAWGALLKRWKNKFASEPAHFRWHDMRHDFASQLVIRKVALNTVRELMGHRTIEMTLRYAHLDDNSLTDAVATLNN